MRTVTYETGGTGEGEGERWMGGGGGARECIRVPKNPRENNTSATRAGLVTTSKDVYAIRP